MRQSRLVWVVVKRRVAFLMVFLLAMLVVSVAYAQNRSGNISILDNRSSNSEIAAAPLISDRIHQDVLLNESRDQMSIAPIINNASDETPSDALPGLLSDSPDASPDNASPLDSDALPITNDTHPGERLPEDASLPLLSVDVFAIARAHGRKLNDETKMYLNGVADVSEEREYIIKFASSIKRDILENVSLQREHADFDVVEVRGSAENIAELLEDLDVEYVELDSRLETLSDRIPWGVGRVAAPAAWNNTNGSGVKIAILDTGILFHDDLSIAGRTSVIGGSYTDAHGHGTAVAGVVSALKNDAGLVGVAPYADIYAVKIMHGSSGGLSDAIAGVQWAMDNNMSIISMSFGMESYSQIFKEVLQDAYDRGILLVAAAGNDGGDVVYPAKYSNVIAVGAVDSTDTRAPFSSHGFELELVAPGVGIETTGSGNGYIVEEGTSMAAPHVTGVSALIWSANTSLTNAQVRAKLHNDAIDLGDPGKDDYYGYGLVQANLGATNFTETSDSYFYEVFNITRYGTENETLVFWSNGTGTVDDVNFTEGYYLIRKYLDEIIEDIIYVNEFGEIELLTVSFTIHDLFTADGTSTTDRYAWVNTSGSGEGSGSLSFSISATGSEDDAYCLDYVTDGDWEQCRYNQTIHRSECNDYSQGLSGNGAAFNDTCGDEFVLCVQEDGLDGSGILNDESIKEQEIKLEWYRDCDNDPGSPTRVNILNTNTFYVFDRRKDLCTSSTTYSMQGRYQSSPDIWRTYKNTLTCSSGKQCDYALDENVTTSAINSLNPCRLQYNESCTSTNQCLTGLSCTGGICQGSETDLEILEIIPIQVVPDVDMVKDKTGYVLIRVRNSAIGTNAVVNVTYEGTKLSAAQGSSPTAYIAAGAEVMFNFTFKPALAGTGKTITANVSII